MKEKQHGSFYGLGIQIQKRMGKITVIAPMEGTPAYKMGIRAGDVITHIGEEELKEDTTTEDVVRKLRGPKGTNVTITLARVGFEEPIRMTITRAEIPTKSVRYAFMLEPGVGYIMLSDFTHTSNKELYDAIEKLEKQGMKKLLFDLRGNPGGVLEQAVDVSDVFVPKGSMVVYTRGRTASSAQEYFAPGDGAPHRPSPRRPGQPGLGLGLRDRRRGDPGPRPRRHRRPAHVGQGPGPERLHAVLWRGPRAHDRPLLHAVRPLDPEGLQRPARLREPERSRRLVREGRGGPEARLRERGLLHRRRPRRVRPGRHHAGRPRQERAGLEAPAAASGALRLLQLRGRLPLEEPQGRGDLLRDARDPRRVLPFVEKSAKYSTAEELQKEYGEDPNRSLVDLAIQTEIVSARFGPEAGRRAFASGDPQIQKGLTLFGEADRIASLPKKKRELAIKAGL